MHDKDKNMKRIIILIALCCLMAGGLQAQEQKGSTYRDGSCAPPKYTFCPKNVLYHETHTNFSYLTYNSINWETTMICRSNFMMTFRLGGIYYNFVKLRLTGAPIGFNFLFGGDNWLVDAGFGGTYLYIYRNYDELLGVRYNDNTSVAGVNLHLGLRYEIQRSFFFKAVVDPMYVLYGKENVPLMKHAFQPMIGIGLGYTFDD